MKLKLPKLSIRRRQLFIPVSLVGLLLVGAISFQVWYSVNLRPVSSSTTTQLFIVNDGSSAKQIAANLKTSGLVRSSRAFVYYVGQKDYRSKLQAGTYKFSPSMGAKTIAKKLAFGEIDKNWITILPGKRLDQIEHIFLQVGYSQSAIEDAFNSANYPKTASLLEIPSGASFEGFLYPDSYQRDQNTPASAIVQEALNATIDHLTDDIKAGFASQGLNTFQGVTLASIVAQESGDPNSQPTVAQVFLTRLKQNMALGSDVTAFYASAIAGQSPSVGIDSPYNTRIHAGLPPGPIGNVTASSLSAVAHPASSDYLFFVAGDDGVIHFSHTEAEHEAAIKQYCKKLCQ